ncbi:MAG: DNA polymerase III subunit epsilon [Gammaproteobacteria bacterium]|nr:MAG: DNA polymerase III subunit epsilon [Gammaproteobacteria bacterium]
MRQIVLDTETTGLEVEQGHRVIEIGCVELLHRRRTSRTYHRYLFPEREIDSAAEQVHGITREMLADKPRFREIAGDFLDFISGAELVIHNAEFDIGFLDNEFRLAGYAGPIVRERCSVIDTLALARQKHPGQRNSLDALCRRYGIDLSVRDYHGALLDAHLLASVFLEMTGGQASLTLEETAIQETAGPHRQFERGGRRLKVPPATAEEIEAHERQLDVLQEACPQGALWRMARP